ncbi:MAG TPA: O-antigen ligase family protein [Thermoleophilaceae bacterium]|nr:O-antigen ligase family protein [Thermoleophilaceae bacterium]
MSSPARIASAGLLALPGALVIFLAFSGGGYFPGTFSLAGLVLALVLVLRVTLADKPFAGLTGLSVAIIVLLGLFAVWTLGSVIWSDSGGRAFLEFERALMYLLAFTLCASLPQTSARLRWMLRGIAAGLVVVCGIALVTRVAADVWPISENVSANRLSFPLTYWNSLGLMAAGGGLLCLHLTADEREPLLVRALGAAALPVLMATLLFTFSRGGIVAGAVGLVLYVVLGHPRGLLGALVATLAPVVITLKVAYDAELLQTGDFAAPAAVDQGHEVALVVVGAAVVAALVRVAMAPVDNRLARVELPTPPRAALAGGGLLALALVVGALVAAGAPGYVSDQYDGFVNGGGLKDDDDDLRARLTNPANNGRLDHWEVAVDAYRDHRVRGAGAGTYQLLWARDRPIAFSVVDGHSLYLEVLGELGLVGLALMVAAILALLFGLARRLWRHPAHRALYAAVLSVTVAWALRAGADWDWEMPAVTLWVWCLGALAVGARRGKRPLAIDLPRTARVAIALALLAVAVTPLVTIKSQTELNRSRKAFERNDCRTSIDASLASISALPMRSEPWELLGYCDLRLDRTVLARRALREAVARDPRSWEPHYGLALVLAASGRDPRTAARRARELNPLEPRTRAASRAFRISERASWRRWALRAPLPLPPRR